MNGVPDTLSNHSMGSKKTMQMMQTMGGVQPDNNGNFN